MVLCPSLCLDISLDKVPNNEHVNTRSGFTKRPRIMTKSVNKVNKMKTANANIMNMSNSKVATKTTSKKVNF